MGIEASDSVLFGDIGNTASVQNTWKMLTPARRAGPGVGAAASPGSGGKEEKRFPPTKNKSATPWPKSKTLVDMAKER